MPSSTFLKRHHGWLLILCTGMAPLFLGLLFTGLEARQSVHNQQTATAKVLISQVETLSDSAWNIIGMLHQFQGQNCDSLVRPLQLLAAKNAYFRAIGVMQGTHISCSSAFGHDPGELSEIVQRPLPYQVKSWWGLSIAGTAVVPNRPAIVYVRVADNGFGAYTVVEGQYLLDFMRAISEATSNRLQVSFGGGYSFTAGRTSASHSLFFSPVIWQATSAHYPIRVTVTTPAAEVLNTWRSIFFTFLPMAGILSMLFMVLTANWLKRRVTWRDNIKKAIKREEFSVVYQPVYRVHSQCCKGVEALMRWQRPNGEWIRPDIFIAAAEEEGMIVPLTHHLLKLITQDAMGWQVEPGFHLALNVAAEHLQNDCFVMDIDKLSQKLAHKQFQITLELTERSLIKEGDEVAKKLSLLRRRGIKVAIDDFGTGNCSLSYLQTFEIDYLKIDRSFINAIESIEGETPVLDAIIMLSHKLALEVLGEGVETEMQYRYLCQRNVTLIQGWFYARPLSSEAFVTWLMNEGQRSLDHDRPHLP